MGKVKLLNKSKAFIFIKVQPFKKSRKLPLSAIRRSDVPLWSAITFNFYMISVFFNDEKLKNAADLYFG